MRPGRPFKALLDGQLALLSVARKPVGRCHHTPRGLDAQVLAGTTTLFAALEV